MLIRNDKLLKQILKYPLVFAQMLGKDKVIHKTHDKWIRSVWQDGNDYIEAYRGSYKTTCRATIAPIWGLLFYPEARILILKKTSSEAAKALEQISDIYTTNLKLRAIYKEVYDIDNPCDLHKWSNYDGLTLATKRNPTAERNIEGSGIDKALVGKHFDIIIADDIVTKKDRYSYAEREATKHSIRDLHNILNIDGFGIKFSGTPWHEDSAAVIMPPPDKYPVTTNITGITKKQLAEIRKDVADESLFQANYYLRHISTEEKPFSNPSFISADEIEEGQLIAYADPTTEGGKRNDFFSVSIGEIDGGELLVHAGYVWRLPLPKSYDKLQSLCYKHNVAVLVMESNSAQKAIALEMRRRGLVVEPKTNIPNKHQRIMHNVAKNWERIKFLDSIQPEYMKQLMDYIDPVVSAYDDAPDSLAGLIERLTRKAYEMVAL